MFFEESCPLIIDCVPLVWIVCWMRLARFLVFFCTSSTERLKKSRPIRVGSPPCQAIVDLRRLLMRFEKLADVGFEQLVRHTEAAARIEHLLGEEEAVFAVQVADCPGGFGQQMESKGSLWRGHRSGYLTEGRPTLPCRPTSA